MGTQQRGFKETGCRLNVQLALRDQRELVGDAAGSNPNIIASDQQAMTPKVAFCLGVSPCGFFVETKNDAFPEGCLKSRGPTLWTDVVDQTPEADPEEDDGLSRSGRNFMTPDDEML